MRSRSCTPSAQASGTALSSLGAKKSGDKSPHSKDSRPFAIAAGEAGVTVGGGSDIVSSGLKVRIRLLLLDLPCGSLRDFFPVVHDQKKTDQQDSTLTPPLERCSHRPPTELTARSHRFRSKHSAMHTGWRLVHIPRTAFTGRALERGRLAMFQRASRA